MPDMPPWVVERLLTRAASPWQFELFCARHFSVVERVHYVITSRNYDAGRDARTEFPNRFAGASYIIASLQQESIEAKAREDLKKLLRQDKKPGKVRFCFAADVTEVLRDKIIAAAKKLYNRPFYEVSGRVQLLESIDRFPDVFEKEFENEIDQFRRFMQRDVSHTDNSIGLRVVLGTQLSGTSEQLRMHILRALVMRSIPPVGEVRLPALCASVSEQLSLDPPVHDSYLCISPEVRGRGAGWPSLSDEGEGHLHHALPQRRHNGLLSAWVKRHAGRRDRPTGARRRPGLRAEPRG